jgi:N-acetylmuramoyl-L-alanine amidase
MTTRISLQAMSYGLPRTRAVLAAFVATTAVVGCMAGASDVHATEATQQSTAALTPNPATDSNPSVAAAPSRSKPLTGKTVGIDPGHNGQNYAHPKYIQHQIWNGREYEDCNTTGTSTNGGYSEAKFTWHVASYLRRDLKAEGAHVVLTRHNNHGVGPCVNTRAHIINHAHADVGIDIHGDGGPASGRGFAILEPVKDKYNKQVIGKSAKFGRVLRHRVLGQTKMPTSTYDGENGITHRSDLAGLNLTKVPLVLIECGNMRNATDARLMTSKSFQKRLAKAFASSITKFGRTH